jgi:hypothetical protein
MHFIKRCQPGRGEAVHYRELARLGVPLPRLHLATQEGDGSEILHLETLSAVGLDRGLESEWRAFLSLLARFNACEVTPEYEAHLHPYHLIGQVSPGRWLLGGDPWPTGEAISETLKSVGIMETEREVLVTSAQLLFGEIRAHKTGLLHLDFLPDNVGWRGERAELVVFDLQKNARGPRFADVAPHLSGELYREPLARFYLDEYARFGGERVGLETFRQEITELFWAHRLMALPDLAPERRAETLNFLRAASKGNARVSQGVE